jgi:hypothetical protein
MLKHSYIQITSQEKEVFFAARTGIKIMKSVNKKICPKALLSVSQDNTNILHYVH